MAKIKGEAVFVEWEQVVDVSDKVGFDVPAGHQYTNSFVVYYDDWYDGFEDDDGAPLNDYWRVVVYDGWNGKHSGGSESYKLPRNWEMMYACPSSSIGRALGF